jgi:hypothetical protein
MRIHSEAFWLPKAGNTEEEYEDAFWPQEPVDSSAAVFRVAVADGATEASFSALWAQLLVKAYCEGKFDEGLHEGALVDLQTQWIQDIGSQPLPWYAEQKVLDGAFSSLIGVTFQQASSPAVNNGSVLWRAVAVGDSCLFQVRDDRLIQAFPLNNSNEFNNRPALISSRQEFNDRLPNSIFDCEGMLEIDDSLYLMTDALACWFLSALEQGHKPWKIKHWVQIKKWVTGLRRTKKIRNDDVTIVQIERMVDYDD